MPMPEMPEEDFNLWGVPLYRHVKVNKDRQACYAAGKADALPPWPPEEGKLFKAFNDPVHYLSNCIRFSGDEQKPWETYDSESEEWFNVDDCDGDSSASLTAAYFQGKLEEVK